ncbi:hypothetical protein KCP75_22395 [Salmonella enterica subsp. enterica]|nr:hypothetical protein KCP75_22395 [Salmonella enterica subsp. enterica]
MTLADKSWCWTPVASRRSVSRWSKIPLSGDRFGFTTVAEDELPAGESDRHRD